MIIKIFFTIILYLIGIEKAIKTTKAIRINKAKFCFKLLPKERYNVLNILAILAIICDISYFILITLGTILYTF